MMRMTTVVVKLKSATTAAKTGSGARTAKTRAQCHKSVLYQRIKAIYWHMFPRGIWRNITTRFYFSRRLLLQHAMFE